VRALNGLVNGVLNGSGGGAGEFDEFIDWVFHVQFLCLVAAKGFCIQPFGSQITGRTDYLLWGVTLPQFEARFSRD
jgi:hypothetical protein